MSLKISSASVSRSNSSLSVSSPSGKEHASKNHDLKRLQIVGEIIETEKNYVQDLETITKVFMNPLRAAIRCGRPIVDSENFKMIFSNLDAILACNTKLLEGMGDKFSNWNANQSIGDVFIERMKSFKVYTTYVNFFPLSKKTLGECEASSGFREFLKACQVKPECRRQTLAELLIVPVQRMPRYVLLLQELLKHTRSEHPDHPLLTSSLETLKEIMFEINEAKRKTEQQFQLFELIQDIEGCPATLLSANRQFLSKIDVLKLSSEQDGGELIGAASANQANGADGLDGLDVANFTIILFNDVVEIVKRRKKPQIAGLQLLNKRAYKHILCAQVKDINLVEVEDAPALPNVFGIAYPDPCHVYQASSLEEKRGFLALLKKGMLANGATDENFTSCANPLADLQSSATSKLKRSNTWDKSMIKMLKTTKSKITGKVVSRTGSLREEKPNSSPSASPRRSVHDIFSPNRHSMIVGSGSLSSLASSASAESLTPKPAPVRGDAAKPTASSSGALSDHSRSGSSPAVVSKATLPATPKSSTLSSSLRQAAISNLLHKSSGQPHSSPAGNAKRVGDKPALAANHPTATATASSGANGTKSQARTPATEGDTLSSDAPILEITNKLRSLELAVKTAVHRRTSLKGLSLEGEPSNPRASLRVASYPASSKMSMDADSVNDVLSQLDAILIEADGYCSTAPKTASAKHSAAGTAGEAPVGASSERKMLQDISSLKDQVDGNIAEMRKCISALQDESQETKENVSRNRDAQATQSSPLKALSTSAPRRESFMHGKSVLPKIITTEIPEDEVPELEPLDFDDSGLDAVSAVQIARRISLGEVNRQLQAMLLEGNQALNRSPSTLAASPTSSSSSIYPEKRWPSNIRKSNIGVSTQSLHDLPSTPVSSAPEKEEESAAPSPASSDIPDLEEFDLEEALSPLPARFSSAQRASRRSSTNKFALPGGSASLGGVDGAGTAAESPTLALHRSGRRSSAKLTVAASSARRSPLIPKLVSGSPQHQHQQPTGGRSKSAGFDAEESEALAALQVVLDEEMLKLGKDQFGVEKMAMNYKKQLDEKDERIQQLEEDNWLLIKKIEMLAKRLDEVDAAVRRRPVEETSMTIM